MPQMLLNDFVWTSGADGCLLPIKIAQSTAHGPLIEILVSYMEFRIKCYGDKNAKMATGHMIIHLLFSQKE